MALTDALLPEFDREMAVTRRVLERVPFDDFNWKPHRKSMSIGELASHLCNILSWVPILLKDKSFDISGAGPSGAVASTSAQQLVASYDEHLKAARDLIASTSDGQFMEPWTLKEKGKEVFTMPRIAVLRTVFLSHSIHHRGQLSVYLRLRDIPVPPIYGPSADER
jgi:uncharacterized damage-inducible protein DinB